MTFSRLFLILICVTSIAQAGQSYQVLIVHAYSQEYPWTKSQHQGFVDKLTQNSLAPVNISTEYLDTKRRPYSAEYAHQYSRLIEEKYSGYILDIIYVTDDNGYLFARDHLQTIFPGIPIIFSGVNDYSIISEIESLPIRGVFEEKNISKNLNLIDNFGKINPEIIILGDGSNTYRAIEFEIKRQLIPRPDINATYVINDNIDNLLEDLRLLDQKYLFLTTIGGIKASSGEVLSPKTVISEIIRAGDFTIFTMEDAYFVEGVLGGYVTSGKLQGETAAGLALEALKDSIFQVSNITSSPNLYIFDQSELNKQNILLPEVVRKNADFHNIPLSFYEKNRAFVLGLLAFTSVLLIILVGLVLNYRIRRIAEEKLNEAKRIAEIEHFQNAIIEWSSIKHENITEAFKKAIEISSKSLGVKRVSIWIYNEEKTGIECRAMYINGEGHISGGMLLKEDYPLYFRAIDTGRRLPINDVRSNPITSELRESYLIPNDIYSMLDIPIFYDGEVIGVVCHEHVGKVRNWTTNEQEFSSLITSDISLSLEIDKRKSIEKNLAYQAYHDSLTGLPNRALFLDRLEQGIRLANRENSHLAVLFLDLDNFKQINDSFGHSAGDTVLISISERLKEALREMDTIARLGGDEFTILLSDFKNEQDINDIVLKIFDSIHASLSIGENELFVTTSIGISVYPNDGTNAEILLRNADTAMYRAKQNGRNRFQFYTADMTENAFTKVLMSAHLNRAIEQDEFEIHYQPQYDIQKQQLIGLEALIRWHHPERGFLPPEKFLLSAVESGLIVRIDRWVMRKSLQKMKEWKNEGLQLGRLCLNLTAQHIAQPDFLEYLMKLMKDIGCKGESITFEITEDQLIKNPQKTIDLLNHISELNIKISIDHFGTGYSSLAILKKLPVDTLKLDRTFIRNIPGDEDDSSVVKSMIAIATNMKIDVLAEGVETSEQLDFLTREGCNLIQGYYLSPPVSASEVPDLTDYPLV